MNFQVVNTGQKKNPGGYIDDAGTPAPALAEAFRFVDDRWAKWSMRWPRTSSWIRR